MLALFLIFLFEKKHLIASVIFLLACITRETSLIFIIIVAAFLIHEKQLQFSKVIIWIMPVLLYALFINQYMESSLLVQSKDFLLEHRFFAWRNNLFPFHNFRETSTVVFLMTGIPILLLRQNSTGDQRLQFWSRISIGLIVFNCLIVLISGLVREARLLFLPLILALPLVHYQLYDLTLKFKFSPKREGAIILGSLIIAFLWFSLRQEEPVTFTRATLFSMPLCFLKSFPGNWRNVKMHTCRLNRHKIVDLFA